MLCNMSAVSNNRKITDKKYRLQLIQGLVGNVQNKVKQEDHNRTMVGNTWINIHISYTQIKELIAKTVQYAAVKRWKVVKRGALLFCCTCTRRNWIYPGKCFDKYCMFMKHKQNPINCNVKDKNISVVRKYHV